VVVPVGRADEAICAQLEAVCAQVDASVVEVILAVNDASSGAVATAERLARGAGTCVRVVDASQHHGAAYARNVGAAAAQGDVLAFCDADDLVEPGWLTALVSGLDRFDAVGGRLDEMPGVSAHRRPPPTPDALPTFLGVPYIVSANLAITRERFLAVGGFDTSLHRGEDIAFSWQLLVAGHTLGYVDDARISYRPRTGSFAIVRQHFAYGRGMAQVLCRYGVPDQGHWRPVRGRAVLQPNGQSGGSGGLFAITRRASLAGGRMLGLLAEAITRDRGQREDRAA
jgi:glycosyltransferase involved in cell wall biosynthesis